MVDFDETIELWQVAVRRDRYFPDTPSPSILKRLLKGEGGAAAEMTELSPPAAAGQPGPALVRFPNLQDHRGGGEVGDHFLIAHLS